MANTKRWLLYGAVGALVGVTVKLVRGRREEDLELGRWEEPPPPPSEEAAS